MGILVGAALSLVASVFKSGKSITTKLSVSHIDEYTTVWSFRTISAIVFLIPLLITNGLFIPKAMEFWVAGLANTIAFTLTSLCIAKAYKISDISLISPLLSFVPLFVVVPAWLILGEQPTPIAILGIALVVAGAYILNVQDGDQTYFDPLRTLVNDEGARYIAVALCLLAFTPTIDKIGLSASTPLLWVFSTHVGLSIILLPIVKAKNATIPLDGLQRNWKLVLALGVFNAGIWLAQAQAYTLINVAYVQAIKRASIFLSIAAGSVLFNEERVFRKLIAASVILVGVVLITLAG